jgi:hypothetical protein
MLLLALARQVFEHIFLEFKKTVQNKSGSGTGTGNGAGTGTLFIITSVVGTDSAAE